MRIRTLLTATTTMTFIASATVAMAAQPVLTIYTYESFASEWGPGPAIETAFEAECACDVNFVALDSSIGILGRVQLEGASSPADIVLGLDTNLMATAQQAAVAAFQSQWMDGTNGMEVHWDQTFRRRL